MTNQILNSGTHFFCDFYHLTMAQAWFKDNKHNQTKTSEAFFRKNPFNGGYLIAAGLGEFLEWAENWKIGKEDTAYLAKQKDAYGNAMFDRDFLKFLEGQKLQVSIQAVPEGEIVFPDEPVFSVTGPCWQVDMVEAAFLNIFNSQSLMATKASRIVQAAGADGVQRPVLEFGLRRAQELGAFTPTRASYIGGCAGTSNVAAARYYDIPAKGTMAHSFVMSYEDELSAFKAYMQASPGNTTLLVDTYDTREGLKNAVRASRETGIPLQGVRIDSGDLAFWYREARRIFEEAGMPQVKLVASNDLDEHLIEHLIMVQGAKYDIWAAGTKLVTAYDTPALGGVFKTKEYMGVPKMKIAEGKNTIPGATNVIRMLKGGKYNGDVIVPQNHSFLDRGCLQNNINSYKLRNTGHLVFEKGNEGYELLKPVVVNGQVIAPDIHYNLHEIRNRAKANLDCLDEAYKRLNNPHLYGVGLEQKIKTVQDMIIFNAQSRHAV